jgi:hypothetical protein
MDALPAFPTGVQMWMDGFPPIPGKGWGFSRQFYEERLWLAANYQ